MLKPLFDKVSGLKGCIFIQKETQTQLLFCEYCEIFKSSFFIEDLFIVPFETFNFMIIYIKLYFTSVKLAHVTERNSQQIDQNLFQIFLKLKYQNSIKNKKKFPLVSVCVCVEGVWGAGV